MFISAPPPVSTRRLTTPHSRMKFPNMNMPMSGVTAGIRIASTAAAISGNRIFSSCETGLSCCMTICRS